MKSTSVCSFARTPIVAALLLVPFLANAQDYPKRPITIVVPYAAGGGTDSIARDLAKLMSDKLGQSVVIENKGGGGGTIGSSSVAKANPDGYTLLFASSSFVTQAATEKKQSYDVNKDFAPVAMIGRGPLIVVANKVTGAKTIPELISASKAKPEGFTFCSSGPGTILHLAGELFKQRTGANLTHVPYKGSGPATTDLLAGRTQVFFATVPAMLPYVKRGQIELLGVTGAQRSALFPNTPTLTEAGVPNYNITTWWGLLAPAGTPEAIVTKLNAVVNDVASKDPLKGRLASEGAEPFSGKPAEFGSTLSSEYALWKDLLKTGNITTQ